MKRIIVFAVCMLLVIPAIAFGAVSTSTSPPAAAPAANAAVTTVEGTIQGYNCVSQGRTCPIGQEDPLVATESTFVVLTPDNKYYFVPNVDRAIMARHITEQVRVKGTVVPQYNSIRAQSLEIYKDGKWKTVWTPQMQDIFQDPGIGPYPYRQPSGA